MDRTAQARKAGEAGEAQISRAFWDWCLTEEQGKPPEGFKREADGIRSVTTNCFCLGSRGTSDSSSVWQPVNLSQNHRVLGWRGWDSTRSPRPDMHQPLSRTAPSELCPHCRWGPCIHDVSPTGLKVPLRRKLNLNHCGPGHPISCHMHASSLGWRNLSPEKARSLNLNPYVLTQGQCTLN